MKNETAIVSTTETTAEVIPEQTARLVEKSIADNTMRNRKQALRAFSYWLRGREITDGHLAEYATHLFDIGKAPGTISIVVSAVKWLLKHRNNGTPGRPAYHFRDTIGYPQGRARSRAWATQRANVEGS